MKSRDAFFRGFHMIGSSWELTEDLTTTMEKIVCKLYNSKNSKLNEAMFELFNKKYLRENKVIDLSLLPPCP